MNPELTNTLNSIVANATPLVIASIGETIAERSGMINLSLNGSILLSAMSGFVAAKAFDSVLAGFLVAAIVGALIALIISISSINLRQDQVAIGFVLTLLAADLATFLGQPHNNTRGPVMGKTAIPLLEDIPFFGPVLFNHSVVVYFSFILVILVWYFLFHMRGGLALRAVGERPEAAYARGTQVNRLRHFYMLVGGALVGIAGASYSLGVKAGWSANPAMNGDGWIALAIVIFGGWHPFRVLLGAYLFAMLRALASGIQRADTGIPLVLLNTLPWILMVVTLMLVNSGGINRLLHALPGPLQRRARGFLRSDPPAALGVRFEPDQSR
jgi:general nucleoside transport system permease protein